MRITHLSLRNWRNFKRAEFDLQNRMFMVGPNASGKSNLLDALRFLRQIVIPGGGFQNAVDSRGGMRFLRCLAARNFNHGYVTIRIVMGTDDEPSQWTYELTFTAEQRGQHRPIIKNELVKKKNKKILTRPSKKDKNDQKRMTQTALEQVNANHNFREIVDFFLSIRYLHLVPHIIRKPQQNKTLSDDPYGSDFISKIAKTPEKTRMRRFNVINNALKAAIPQFDQLKLVQDEIGFWHLEARYEHWRSKPAVHNEQHFSDGTLRLIGLLWLLLERKRAGGVILLEEPELSLNSEIICRLPGILSRVSKRNKAQVIISTHSNEILADPGISVDEIVILRPSSEGTETELAGSDSEILNMLDIGFELSEILPSRIKPVAIADFSSRAVFQ